MKRAALALAAVMCLTALPGCMIVASPAVGALYTEVNHGGDAEGALGAKEGRACAQSILGLVATGDASIKAAANAGRISSVTSVDHYSRNVLGILGEYCTIVRGS